MYTAGVLAAFYDKSLGINASSPYDFTIIHSS